MKTGLVLGCFETVSFPELGVENVIAKVDTGAFSGALHCTNIRVIRRGSERKRVLQFTPHGKRSKTFEVDTFISKYVRSATGHRTRRHIIDTTIEIQGIVYPIRIGLSDRSDLKRPALIGRRFLRENNIVVDVRINQEQDDEGEDSK